jgi:hypothetical protein
MPTANTGALGWQCGYVQNEVPTANTGALCWQFGHVQNEAPPTPGLLGNN